MILNNGGLVEYRGMSGDIAYMTMDEYFKAIHKHETTDVIIKGEPIKIDTILAPIIKELNNIGIETKFCCQGDGTDKELAYITFKVSECGSFDFRPGTNELTIWWVRK